MRINALASEEWFHLNRTLREHIGCQSKVHVFPGFHQALYEVLMGLSLRMSHKKKIVAHMGLGDHMAKVSVDLARQGVRIKPEFEEDLASEEKKVLAYVHDMDDALTTELYNHLEQLRQLSGSKTHRVHLAHYLYQDKPSFAHKLSDHDIVIAAIDNDLALVFTGEKTTFPWLSVTTRSWSVKRDWPLIEQKMAQKIKTYAKEIKVFESHLPQGVRPWFEQSHAQRLYDRSLVVVENADALALMDLLKEKLDIPATEPGETALLETTSFSRWHSPQVLELATQKGVNPDDLRGLLQIHGSLLNEEFNNAFHHCLDELKTLSS